MEIALAVHQQHVENNPLVVRRVPDQFALAHHVANVLFVFEEVAVHRRYRVLALGDVFRICLSAALVSVLAHRRTQLCRVLDFDTDHPGLMFHVLFPLAGSGQRHASLHRGHLDRVVLVADRRFAVVFPVGFVRLAAAHGEVKRELLSLRLDNRRAAHSQRQRQQHQHGNNPANCISLHGGFLLYSAAPAGAISNGSSFVPDPETIS